MKKTVRQVGDSIFDKRMSKIAKKYPYQSFVVMSAALEFLGKCYSKRENFQESRHSMADCRDVINSLSSLKEYVKYNDLYHNLRCGMLHAFTPDGIILKRGANDVANNKIGARQFCEDLKKAWEELKANSDYKSFLKTTIILDVDGALSGSTITQSQV